MSQSIQDEQAKHLSALPDRTVYIGELQHDETEKRVSRCFKLPFSKESKIVCLTLGVMMLHMTVTAASLGQEDEVLEINYPTRALWDKTACGFLSASWNLVHGTFAALAKASRRFVFLIHQTTQRPIEYSTYRSS